MALLPQQNVFLIRPQQTRIVVVTISIVTTVWIVTATIMVVAVTSEIVTTNNAALLRLY